MTFNFILNTLSGNIYFLQSISNNAFTDRTTFYYSLMCVTEYCNLRDGTIFKKVIYSFFEHRFAFLLTYNEYAANTLHQRIFPREDIPSHRELETVCT